MNIEQQKERLESEKTMLEAQLQTVGRRNPSNPADWEAVPQEVGQEADPTDQADLMEGLGDNMAILNDLENRYNDVLAALTRIAGGTYGICSACGEPIEEDRLEAEPAAKTCKTHLNA